uniref:Uncharacterized protein n=1 Tax=Rhizophora mucronata TaxID=61149 RepID=A0A2P2IJ84_RHIMU
MVLKFTLVKAVWICEINYMLCQSAVSWINIVGISKI